jgi:hypothetical protein
MNLSYIRKAPMESSAYILHLNSILLRLIQKILKILVNTLLVIDSDLHDTVLFDQLKRIHKDVIHLRVNDEHGLLFNNLNDNLFKSYLQLE